MALDHRGTGPLIMRGVGSGGPGAGQMGPLIAPVTP